MGRCAEAAQQGATKVLPEDNSGIHDTDGGTLLIGIEDGGNIVGLDKDLSLVGGSRDKFEQTLVNLISDDIGPAFSHYYRVRFEPVDGKLVCVVEVDAVSEGVFVKGEKGKEFYVRVGNTTKSLDPADTHAYLAART
jgi:predicted HTH transcriptional regulator